MGSISSIMSGCMAAGKPRIAILMAVYEPRMDWLREQLLSLEKQTYPNLKLYIREDHSPNVPFGEIEDCVKDCIQSFPYEIQRNEKNLGSNETFQRLTEEAEGDYFAYCDQDDIWLPEKLEVLQQEMEASGAELVCSDMYIIDGDGKQVADSITKVRRRHKFASGEGLAKELLVRNFVTGCTMLVRAETAKECVSFCPYMVHDYYIALCCAAKGMIQSVDRQLIRYRIHGGNQTGVLAGVRDKESYYKLRILEMRDRFQWLKEYWPYRENLRKELEQCTEWIQARQDNWNRIKGRNSIRRWWSFFPKKKEFLFECIAPYLPTGVFKLAIWMGQNNYI